MGDARQYARQTTDAPEPTSPTPAVAPPVQKPANPWRGGLITIAVLGLMVGVTLICVGAGLYGSYDPGDGQGDSGLVQMFFGSSVAVIGFMALLSLFAAEMVLWKPPVGGVTMSARNAAHQSRSH